MIGWFAFPLIKLAKKLKVDTTSALSVEEMFPLIKLAKKLKVTIIGDMVMGNIRFPLIKLAKKLKVFFRLFLQFAIPVSIN